MSKASSGDGWNSSWAISNPKRCCECAALNMPANLGNSAVAMGLEKVSFHSNSKETKWEKESEVSQSCPTLCDPMDCSLPGSSVHGIFQTRILEWVATSFSRGSSQPRDRTHVSCVSCIAGRFFTHWAMGEAPWNMVYDILDQALVYSTQSSVPAAVSG